MTPFTEERFEEFCLAHQISARTKALITASFKAPARRVRPGKRNSVSKVPCPKMGFVITAESNLERACLLDHAFDDKVVGYVEQPHTKLHLNYLREDGRRIRANLIVDCAVFHEQDGLVLEEVKPWTKLVELSRKDPTRYRLVGNRFESPPAEDAALLLGAKFRFVTEKTIPEARSQNHNVLFDYTGASGRPLQAQLDQLERLFSGRDFIEARELGPHFDRDIVLGAVAHRKLFIDIDRDRLIRFDRLILYRNAQALDALVGLHRAAAPSSFDQDLDDVTPGDRIDLDGVLLTVNVITDRQLFLADASLTPITLERSTVREQLESGKAFLIDARKTLSGPLAKASVENIREAQRRIAIVTGRAVAEHLGPTKDVCSRTRRTWKRNYRQAIAAGTDPLLALMPRSYMRGNRERRIDEQELALLRNHIESVFLQTNNMPIKAGHENYKRHAEEAGYVPVSVETYRNEVQKFDTFLITERREGLKSAQNVEEFDEFLESSPERHGRYPMHVVHIDHTVLDIFTLSGQTEEKLTIRPTLTLAIDAFTRAIVGMHISLQKPSKEHVLVCITDIVRRFKRLPTELVVDGGSEFYSTDVETALAYEGVCIRSREGKPRSGNVIERAFGMTNKQVLHSVYGNTKLSKNVRLLTSSVDPQNLACVPTSALMEGLEEYWFAIHNLKWKKMAHFMTPDQKFKKGLRDLGERKHKRINLDKNFLIRMLPTIPGNHSRIVDAQRGFPFNYGTYNHPVFYSSRGKTQITHIKLNPWDPSKVFGWYNNEWIECTCRNHAELVGDDLFAKRALFEELPELVECVRAAQNDTQKDIAGLVERLNSYHDDAGFHIHDEVNHANTLAGGANTVVEPVAKSSDASASHQESVLPIKATKLPSLADKFWRKAFR